LHKLLELIVSVPSDAIEPADILDWAYGEIEREKEARGKDNASDDKVWRRTKAEQDGQFGALPDPLPNPPRARGGSRTDGREQPAKESKVEPASAVNHSRLALPFHSPFGATSQDSAHQGIGAPRAGAWQVDRERAEAAGLDVQSGRHLTVITDARERTDIEGFADVFDLAVDQWCRWFAIETDTAADWEVSVCVMADPERFRRAGLMPDDLPPFPAGFQVGNRLWVYVQPGDYYTRHLLLHEGTHAFMEQFLGGYGPPWYAEGMAELLALHRWQDGVLTLGHRPATRDEVPWWGRVRLVQEDIAAGRAKTLAEVMEYPVEAFREVNAYGWAWAACEFLDRHPATQAVFRELPAAVRQNPAQFNRAFRESLSEIDWQELEFHWQLMIGEIDYGFDVAAAVPVEAKTEPVDGGFSVVVATDRGWQSVAIPVRPGDRFEFSSADMYQIREDEGVPWPCDAGGVTIEYYRGRPLGQLIAAVRPEQGGDGGTLEWIDLGRSRTVACEKGGTLYLRINESPAALGDNSGAIRVQVVPVSD
jgi:hypothetical protein